MELVSNALAEHEIIRPRGRQNGCFGCGDDNDLGLQLKFFVDQNQRIICHLRLANHFQGPPGHAHGGIIATLLDEAMSKANRHRNVVAMTRQISIDYLRPVPLQSDLVLEGRFQSQRARKHCCSAELRNAHGSVLASATGIFVEFTTEALLRRAAKDSAPPA